MSPGHSDEGRGGERLVRTAPLKIGASQLAQPRTIEARIVAAVHDAGRKPFQATHRLQINGDAAARDLIQQRAVIDGVAREQCAAA